MTRTSQLRRCSIEFTAHTKRCLEVGGATRIELKVMRREQLAKAAEAPVPIEICQCFIPSTLEQGPDMNTKHLLGVGVWRGTYLLT